MNEPSQNRLVDTMIEAYVGWRGACLQVNDQATAVDEARVAEAYARLVRAADQFVSGEPDPAEPPEGQARERAGGAGDNRLEYQRR